MAQERPITPEKQLLNLIENSNAKEEKSSEIKAESAKRQKRHLFSLLAWLSKLYFSKDRIKKWAKESKPSGLHLRIINRVLLVCIILLFVYFTSSFISSIKKMNDTPDLIVDGANGSVKPLGSKVTSVINKPVSHYLEKAGERDIFRMGFTKKAVKTEEEVDTGPTSRIIEATKHLRLVGISWSSNPQAMIEDTKAIKTFFINKGQMIGKVRVQDIGVDKIILEYEGEEIELK